MEPFETFDLDAVLAERALDRPKFTFRFGGEEFSLPPTVDLRAAAFLSGGDLLGGLKSLMGAAQWERLCAVEAVFDTDALAALMDRYMAYAGVSVGESEASTASSSNTAARSRPTSNGSTQPTLVR